ncbi:hypothetical protein K503DRAFT_774030 [Rhizopogon vinicolor AM-OR11-026]|uniref:Uncharacterized protein n=1 Tax=Rhizopogon vinicolor AM-OR11-026 TaxID=1314800 RepID=A0A1B7MQR8_9AGAM|nr:hypothetical protein K503DRAFT_774030 [Rhizopogon vinicolor AM-OR11-026]
MRLGLGIPLDLPVKPNPVEHFEDESALRTLKECRSIFRDQLEFVKMCVITESVL